MHNGYSLKWQANIAASTCSPLCVFWKLEPFIVHFVLSLRTFEERLMSLEANWSDSNILFSCDSIRGRNLRMTFILFQSGKSKATIHTELLWWQVCTHILSLSVRAKEIWLQEGHSRSQREGDNPFRQSDLATFSPVYRTLLSEPVARIQRGLKLFSAFFLHFFMCTDDCKLI